MSNDSGELVNAPGQLFLRCAGIVVCLVWCWTAQSAEEVVRVSRDLVVLYDFGDASGIIVRDRAGVADPIDLTIEDPDKVRRSPGALEVRGSTLISSLQPPRRLIQAIKRSGALTIEAWVEPSRENQSGPARMVTLSKDSTNRNFTLGQDGNQVDVRLRSLQTSNNGLPSLAAKSGSLTLQLAHLVYTRDRDGQSRIWVNGKLSASGKISGRLSNWQRAMRLALGNEINKSRPWLGTYHLVAIYQRALSAKEIEQNYAAGAGVLAPPVVVRKTRDPRETHFELEVAPILANQCLECHDALTRKGGLDLSQKSTAITGGDTGPAFISSNAKGSLLWQLIEQDAMPHKRNPLASREKRTIQKWLNDGAVWTLRRLDPAVYVHGGRPDANWLRRLTTVEYIETVRSLFAVDISKEARALLPPEVRADGFSNTAYNLNVELKHIEAYQRLAGVIVRRVDIDAFRSRFKKRVTFTDKDMGDLIKKMGQTILRGPLENREVIAYRGIATTLAATEDSSIREATAAIIEAMLQSPRFLYRMERQRGDGSAQPLDEFELASRMSYMIWGGPPDARLFQAAAKGDLYDEASILSEADRMLQDARAMIQAERFFADWLHLPRLDYLQPSREKFPAWNPVLAEDMRRETIAFVREVVWRQNRPLSDLLNAQVTFLTPRLAAHYGLPVKDSGGLQHAETLVRYDLANVQSRGGLLTQGSLLTVGGDEASMVTRGLLVMHELLRGVVKDPPPCVDTTPVPSKPGLSQRGIAEARIANKTCAGCHARFEPLAYGLEKFDGVGGYHEKDEHGNALREDGQILFPGDAKRTVYRSTRQLMDALAGSERVQESMTWKLTQFALGRPLTAADAGVLQEIHAQAQRRGGTYKATIGAIVSSELVTLMMTGGEQ